MDASHSLADNGARFRRMAVVLVALCVLLQAGGWLADVPTDPRTLPRILFALAEMSLLLALLWNGWRIRAFVHAQAASSALARSTATLVFGALLLCVGGDAINRNLGASYYAYDHVIEHSYLADSVWFFFPGYLLFIVAAWRATAAGVPAWLRAGSLAAGAVAGVATFAGLVLPGTSDYVAAMTGGYSVLISLMVPAALWIAMAYGRPAWPVALGAALATVADALIGQFWLFGEGWYPGVAYLNFGVYFLSQALVQQFPPVVAAGGHAVPR